MISFSVNVLDFELNINHEHQTYKDIKNWAMYQATDILIHSYIYISASISSNPNYKKKKIYIINVYFSESFASLAVHLIQWWKLVT